MRTITLTQEEVETLVGNLVDQHHNIHEDLQDETYPENTEGREQAINDVHNIESILRKVA